MSAGLVTDGTAELRGIEIIGADLLMALAAVERIEILAQGASAISGSPVLDPGETRGFSLERYDGYGRIRYLRYQQSW